MIKKEIFSNEYAITTLESSEIFQTNDLNNEVAFSFHSVQLGKAGLARHLDKKQILRIFHNLLTNIGPHKPLINIYIIGGDESEFSSTYVEMLVNTLNTIDNKQNIINIKAFDVGNKKHPNSIVFDPSSNLLHSASTFNSMFTSKHYVVPKD